MRYLLLCLALLCITFASVTSLAEIQPPPAGHEDRFYDLLKELRCLVCQNQALSDSNSELAGDLRDQVIKMLGEGASDDEIIDFMVARYGDFVIYKPRFKPSTWVLWIGPFALFVIGLFVLLYMIRRRGQLHETTLSGEERERLNRLLKNSREGDH